MCNCMFGFVVVMRRWMFCFVGVCVKFFRNEPRTTIFTLNGCFFLFILIESLFV